jgi:serine/threonine protein kinase
MSHSLHSVRLHKKKCIEFYSYSETDKIMRLLGQGTFGKVVECYDRVRRTFCAIKIIRAIPKYRDASKIEIRVLNTLKKHDPLNLK